jgi:hypothetical protein
MGCLKQLLPGCELGGTQRQCLSYQSDQHSCEDPNACPRQERHAARPPTAFTFAGASLCDQAAIKHNQMDQHGIPQPSTGRQGLAGMVGRSRFHTSSPISWAIWKPLGVAVGAPYYRAVPCWTPKAEQEGLKRT